MASPAPSLENNISAVLRALDGMQQRRDTPVGICVIGNIGVGKTTFIRALAIERAFVHVPEPVDEFENIAGENLLREYYAHPHAVSLRFQTAVLLLQARDFARAHDNARRSGLPLLMERCWMDSLYCFAERARAVGEMSTRDWNFLRWIAQMQCTPLPPSFLFVYLTADVETCIRRVRERGRQGEEHVTAERLHALDSLYDSYVLLLRSSGYTVLELRTDTPTSSSTPTQ